MIVLDTHCWLWWLHETLKLSTMARKAIDQAEKPSGIKVSSISVWEIALKNRIGKLVLPFEIHEWYRKASVYPHITIEPLSPQDAIDSTLLPGEFHRDPADRMIVAMARRYGAALVTSDEKIRSYEHVRTVW